MMLVTRAFLDFEVHLLGNFLWQGEVEGIERTRGRTEVLVDEGSTAVGEPFLVYK